MRGRISGQTDDRQVNCFRMDRVALSSGALSPGPALRAAAAASA